MTLEGFLDEVPDEVPDEVAELHFSIPARTHPTYPHIRAKIVNGEDSVDSSSPQQNFL